MEYGFSILKNTDIIKDERDTEGIMERIDYVVIC